MTKEYREIEVGKIEARYYDSDNPDSEPTLLLDFTSKDGQDMGSRSIEELVIGAGIPLPDGATMPEGQIRLAIHHVTGRRSMLPFEMFVGPMTEEHFSLVEDYVDYILEPPGGAY